MGVGVGVQERESTSSGGKRHVETWNDNEAPSMSDSVGLITLTKVENLGERADMGRKC
jgi:hypothetical protein